MNAVLMVAMFGMIVLTMVLLAWRHDERSA